MKHYETRISEPKPYKICISRTCDLCSREADYGNEWNAGTYNVNETEIEITIKQKEGDSYPEGGSGTEYSIDLCPDCFKSKLVPWLISQEASIKEEQWDW